MRSDDPRVAEATLKNIISLFGQDPIAEAVKELIQRASETIIFLPKNQMTTIDNGSLTIKGGISFNKVIEEGKYTYVDPFLIKKFPLKLPKKGKIREVDFELLNFKGCVRSEEALACIGEKNSKPGGIEALLAFGAKYSDIQANMMVVELGSIWTTDNKDRYIVYLQISPCGLRSLECVVFERIWPPNCSFLVIN